MNLYCMAAICTLMIISLTHKIDAPSSTGAFTSKPVKSGSIVEYDTLIKRIRGNMQGVLIQFPSLWELG